MTVWRRLGFFGLSAMLLLSLWPVALTEGAGAGPAATAAPEGTVREAEPAPTAAPKRRTLKSGSKGEDVTRLQERLRELRYFTLEPDGAYGADTKAAVKTFQRASGLKADGIAGPKTLAALYAEDAAAAPLPVNVLEGALPMLVNKAHPVPETFVPADLVLMTELCDPELVIIKYDQTQGVRTAVEALVRMLEAAREEGVTKWQISAGYRSYQKQTTTLNAKINTYLERNSDWTKARARSAALKTVAEPGASEHHTGLAFDINVPKTSGFLGTPQCTWLHERCWDYGFIIRYQEGKENITGFLPEAWHIRYVGEEHARIIRDRGWCLEEYLEAMGAEAPDEVEVVTETDPMAETAAGNDIETETETLTETATGDEDELEIETVIETAAEEKHE